VHRIGLTGGIASGKSMVADQFAALGAGIVDTDALARELVEPGSAALAEIVSEFGNGIVGADGRLDRPALRRQVFADADRRRRLEAILHPRIREAALARADASGSPYVIVVVPLLFETGFDRLVDRTLAVDCPESVQLDRLIRRDGVAADEARAVLAAQLSRPQRTRAADDVIDNGGAIEATQARVAELHARYLDLARNCSGHRGRAE
jgi:dephospho-CoA kinase